MVTCKSLPELNIALTFQNPILIFVLLLRAPSLHVGFHCRLVILAFGGLEGHALWPKKKISVGVSVTDSFLIR